MGRHDVASTLTLHQHILLRMILRRCLDGMCLLGHDTEVNIEIIYICLISRNAICLRF